MVIREEISVRLASVTGEPPLTKGAASTRLPCVPLRVTESVRAVQFRRIAARSVPRLPVQIPAHLYTPFSHVPRAVTLPPVMVTTEEALLFQLKLPQPMPAAPMPPVAVTLPPEIVTALG